MALLTGHTYVRLGSSSALFDVAADAKRKQIKFIGELQKSYAVLLKQMAELTPNPAHPSSAKKSAELGF